MKFVILICDGAADYPIEELGNRTVLQAADKPNIDRVAKEGRSGLLKTVPDGYAPGSDIANLSIMGYEADRYYPGGRGVIEAASMGVEVGKSDLPMRANIITAKDGNIVDYSADNISNEEARELIELANKEFGDEGTVFYPGVSYRNLLVLKDSGLMPDDLRFDAPHDHPNQPIDEHLCRGASEKGGEWAEKLNGIMLKSIDVFEKSSVNDKRREQNRPLANMLWFWGPGKKKRDFPTLDERFGVKGSVITGIDLIRGIGILAGLKVVYVEGATAYYDTNYEGKADAAAEALNNGDDLVVIHVEAPDEAGHEANLEEKLNAVENIDKRLLARLVNKIDDEFRIGILPDHYTPIKTRKHEMGPIPFAISGPGIERDAVEHFDEESAKKGGYGTLDAPEFIKLLLNGSDKLDE
jgi:2,3-bisphosphoglycerate-independent phosphoglycerate mutase